jgi:hypothetical protein
VNQKGCMKTIKCLSIRALGSNDLTRLCSISQKIKALQHIILVE